MDRAPRRKLWRVLRKRCLPKRFGKLLRDLYTNYRCRVKSEGQFGEWFFTGSGVRQGSVEGPLQSNIYMDTMMGAVLHRCSTAGIRVHYRIDGRWVNSTEMSHGVRIACLQYADDVALLYGNYNTSMMKFKRCSGGVGRLSV